MTRWLAVEGILGAGKTTTVELAASQLNATAVFEQPDEHPLLDAYFAHPLQFSFETELIFLALHRFRVNAARSTRLLSDFAPGKDLVFGALVLPPDDLAMLGTVQAHLWPGGLRPSLTIFLDVPVEVCVQRVATRGRRHERALTTRFLSKLRDGYLANLEQLGDRVTKVELSGAETPDAVARTVCRLAGEELPE